MISNICPVCSDVVVALRWDNGWRAVHAESGCDISREAAHLLLEGDPHGTGG